jgi:hypothetical protein
MADPNKGRPMAAPTPGLLLTGLGRGLLNATGDLAGAAAAAGGGLAVALGAGRLGLRLTATGFGLGLGLGLTARGVGVGLGLALTGDLDGAGEGLLLLLLLLEVGMGVRPVEGPAGTCCRGGGVLTFAGVLAGVLGEGLGVRAAAAAAGAATSFLSHGSGVSTMSNGPGSAFDQVTHMGVTSAASAVRERCESSRRDCWCCCCCCCCWWAASAAAPAMHNTQNIVAIRVAKACKSSRIVWYVSHQARIQAAIPGLLG